MDLHTSDQALRGEAIRRRLGGESRQAICDDLGRNIGPTPLPISQTIPGPRMSRPPRRRSPSDAR